MLYVGFSDGLHLKLGDWNTIRCIQKFHSTWIRCRVCKYELDRLEGLRYRPCWSTREVQIWPDDHQVFIIYSHGFLMDDQPVNQCFRIFEFITNNLRYFRRLSYVDL